MILCQPSQSYIIVVVSVVAATSQLEPISSISLGTKCLPYTVPHTHVRCWSRQERRLVHPLLSVLAPSKGSGMLSVSRRIAQDSLQVLA
ncbi:hypothetical protein EJ03DRAFT_325553 [Teratosphaeria nubilosa]|uniref:Uncharacterized protein n=1 Tax=Teratosphaeria nubilosa TaxID=161662 RepID=A0A6G1LH71_9PEZI|nr:hypothetical protein EJ03DRAFT_325553 [Teratosphaeria nubilosa]